MSVLEQIRRHRIVAAFRGVTQEQAVDTALALYEGGIRMMEITFDQTDPHKLRNTPEIINSIKERLGDRVHLGAGTVLAAEEALCAQKAGAEFLLAPNVNDAVIHKAKELGMGIIPGAFTATEIVHAYQSGADLIKVFPAGNLGIRYLKSLKGPLGHIPLLPMGGVDQNNLKDFLKVAEGVGIGSNLVDLSLIQNKQWTALSELAKEYTTQL